MTVVASCVAGLFPASAGRVHAQVVSPPTGQLQGMMAVFGMVGVVQGQTARLNVVLGHPPTPVQPPDPTRQPPDPASPVSCQVGLAIIDASGMILARSVFEVRSAEAVQLDYVRPRRTLLTPSDRLQLRAVAKAGVGPTPFAPDPTPFAPCSAPIVATLEVFDTLFGQTTAILNPAVLVGFNPQPEPPALPTP